MRSSKSLRNSRNLSKSRLSKKNKHKIKSQRGGSNSKAFGESLSNAGEQEELKKALAESLAYAEEQKKFNKALVNAKSLSSSAKAKPVKTKTSKGKTSKSKTSKTKTSNPKPVKGKTSKAKASEAKTSNPKPVKGKTSEAKTSKGKPLVPFNVVCLGISADEWETPERRNLQKDIGDMIVSSLKGVTNRNVRVFCVDQRSPRFLTQKKLDFNGIILDVFFVRLELKDEKNIFLMDVCSSISEILAKEGVDYPTISSGCVDMALSDLSSPQFKLCVSLEFSLQMSMLRPNGGMIQVRNMRTRPGVLISGGAWANNLHTLNEWFLTIAAKFDLEFSIKPQSVLYHFAQDFVKGGLVKEYYTFVRKSDKMDAEWNRLKANISGAGGSAKSMKL